MNEFDTYLESLENFLDAFIDEGSDQELFAASYIHGHFSVVAAEVSLQISGISDTSTVEWKVFKQTFKKKLIQNINDAIKANELSATDARDVLKVLEDMFTQ